MTCALPAAAACLVAALVPALHPLGEVVAALAGLLTAAVLWTTGRAADRSARPWRLLAAAALFPVTGLLVSVLAAPSSLLEEVVLRWVVIVPGYVLAVVGLLGMVERAALRRTCPRAALELALFATAALVVMQALLVGPGNGWTALSPVARLVLGSAVVATAATMAAGLTVLGGVAAHRQRMAAVLFAGLVALCVGRGTGTSAALLGATDAVPATRVAVVVGLALLVLARLLDAAPASDPAAAGRAAQLRSVLPHLALVVVVGLVVVPLALGVVPTPVTLVGALLCVGLSAAHRWVAAREDHLRGARLRRDEAYFRSLAASTSEAVLVLDARLRVGWTSPALAALLGSTPADLAGRDLLSGRSAVDAADATALRLRLEAGEASGLLTLHVRDGAGGVRCLEASVSDLRADPAVASVVLHCRDVTERETRERALEELAFTDPLTGLPNRAGWEAALAGAVEGSAAGPAADAPGRALLLVDVCGLTEVREHADRDTVSGVLVELGRRLRATVRGDEVVARVAGGVFGVLVTGDGDTADRLADRCLAALERPVGTPAGVFDLTADVGVVVVEPGLSVGELTGRAETAVAAARAGGSARATRWTDALGAAAARRDRLREDLPGAAGRGELWLAFQPIVSMDEQRVVGVEALLRWRHPELGDVPPREFVPIAERAGVIGELQRWVLREATATAAGLPDSDGVPLRLGVNTSASHVAARTLVDDVAAALASSGLAPERLVLEVTEATLLDDGDFVAIDVQALRLMGVHVALDDFGTGTSSLLHLTRLPIDVLKLDRAFVSRVDRDAQSRALCEAVVTVGRALGVDVVAEGVETPAQLGVLRGLGLGFAQGFLLARPLPPADLLRVLREGAGSLWPGLVGLSHDVFPAAGGPPVRVVRGA
ncbi:PAS domain S-box-containing protein/diguanylate cyclase (GGDEF) domain-containing protein [Geodermatophilus dictyosporus]|uniref:PAS domain S-box-containing protein/diguanylate cyclase (GGDEF) domain-containing protein n=1 Tax=Geodermatophilus dictyosporus TaxID=1523247 RepID=A0A1I5KT43_9ACTN|nr:GGDEF domain-containing phosphodiesterase [Geodermatophilus dictyosporus]SFO88118.1 PAS domain S-box-containing protein/diguanylate cyclase (GGDEF) domain-containing protein [Geodermatophilus dictyosporus]